MFRQMGVDVPQDATDEDDGERLAAYVRGAEAAGFDSLWVTDSAAPGVASPLTTLAFAAGQTRRAALGVAVLRSALQSPLRLARDLATLDRLSAGRLVVGVGIGNDREAYRRHGLQVDNRAQHFEAGVVLLRRLMRETTVSSTYPWWPLADTPRPMPPVQQPTPPIWFGARRGAALQRAVRLGDGWIAAGSMSLEDFTDALAAVRRLLGEAGRDPAGFHLAKRVYVYVGEVTTGVQHALARWFQGHYGNAGLAEQVMVAGPAAEVAGHLERLRRVGVGTLVLHPVLDAHEQMQRLAADVAPLVPSG